MTESLTVRILLRRTFIMIGVYVLLRIAFVAYHWSLLRSINTSSLILSVLHGVRFDANIITIIFFPALLLALLSDWLPKPKEWLHRVIAVYLSIVNIPLLWIALGDIEYFSFTGRRVNSSLLNIGGDLRDQIGAIILQYWWLSLLAILFGIIYTKWMLSGWPRVLVYWKPSRERYRGLAWRHALLLIAWAFMMRGGWQLKPLAIPHAFEFDDALLGQLSLNAPFALLKGHAGSDIPEYAFFPHYEEARQQILPPAEPPLATLAGQNVVLIIMESLATEYTGLDGTGPSYTPFIDDLARRGRSFRRHFANGRRSIDAIPSIVSGIPSLMEEPFITSPYQGNAYPRLTESFGAKGYYTGFYHGGNNGTMHFDTFSRQVGFDQYIGRQEYPGPEHDFDGTWGIWDEPFLQYLCDDLTAKTQTKPIFATLFTLTSHNPFKLPAGMEARFPPGTLPIHQVIRYADYALKQFFECAAKQPWYNQTLFVVTGDHTSLSDKLEFGDDLGHFRVPLVFFHPLATLPEIDTNRPVQHVDILPSIYDLLGVRRPEFFPFGVSVFSRTGKPLAYNQEGGTWWMLTPDAFVKGVPQQNLPVFRPDHPTVPLTDAQVMQSAVTRFHGLAQTYSEGLHRNRWMDKER